MQLSYLIINADSIQNVPHLSIFEIINIVNFLLTTNKTTTYIQCHFSF